MEIRAFYEQHGREISRRSWNTFAPRLTSIRAMPYVLSLAFHTLARRSISFSIHSEWLECATFGIKVTSITSIQVEINHIFFCSRARFQGGPCKCCSRAAFSWSQCQCGNEGSSTRRPNSHPPALNLVRLERKHSSSHCILGRSRRSC